MPVSKSERQRALKAVKDTLANNTTAPWTPLPADDDVRQRVLTRKQVCARVGVSFPTIWRWMVRGTFPRARAVGDLKSGWLESEVNAWIAALPVRRLKHDGEAS
jgi:predicted DNA-binding transcriptional regulator AlpA